MPSTPTTIMSKTTQHTKKRRRGRRIASNDIDATLILDETLMGEVSFVSRDIWNELFGGITIEDDDSGMLFTPCSKLDLEPLYCVGAHADSILSY